MTKTSSRPLVIKRRKVVVEGGHHGGAWKVAYADFVTAMMAFFMLMWLLNATTESQRKGLADYFSPELPIARASGGGSGAFSGNNPLPGETMPEIGGGIPGGTAVPTAPAEADALAEALEQLLGAGGERAEPDDLLRHVSLERTDEGLVIELRELPDAPLFDGASPEPSLVGLATTIGEVLTLVANDVAVQAAGADWPERAARAEAMRRAMSDGGLPDDRVARLEAHAPGGSALRVVLLFPEGAR